MKHHDRSVEERFYPTKRVNAAAPAVPQATVTDDDTRRVLYSPTGEVIVSISDRPPVGFA